MKSRILVIAAILFSIRVVAQPAVAAIDKLMTAAADNGYFNGVVVVAEKGQVIYKKGFGYANEENKIANDGNTLFNLCSITKQFTAMAIMMLKEQGKLSYDDGLEKYFPNLPYKNITLRHLLNHTSGLPDYMNLAFNNWPEGNTYANEEAIALLNIHQPPVLFSAGDRFQYCNTGYMLLATIIEKVSGKTYENFLNETIFKPLGMSKTFVLTPANKTAVAKGYVFDRQLAANVPAENSARFSKQVTTIIYPVGDGGIFSCANDMIKWDEALRANKLVKPATLQEAFTSSIANDGKETGYGFGWFVVNDTTNGKMVQHTGGWPGFRNAFIRYTEKHRTLLVLRNSEIEFRGIQPAVNSILDGKPVLPPQPSLGQAFALAAAKGDAAVISSTYTLLKGACIVNEQEINEVGYGLWEKGLQQHALEVMKINCQLFPQSWNAYDSLAEMYLKNGDKENAKLNYQRSVALNPKNDGAKKRLENL